jgi:C_GCAxxG_C_C family probable redox protein
MKGGDVMDESHKNSLLQKAFQLGFDYEKTYRGCSQCTIAAVQDTLNIREDNVFKAATGLAAGGGLTGIGVCGGYAGAIMMISWLCGRERSNFADPEKKRHVAFAMSRRFTQKYIQEFGSIICRDIQTHVFGRPYYIADPHEYDAFEAAGGHDDKCTNVVGKASRLAVEFILEEGLLHP